MSPSLLSALFVQLGLVASPITITEVGAAREGERLAITIKADAAIDPEAATPKLTTDGHLYLYVRDARVTEGNRAWGDGPAEIRAHRHKHQVELVVPLGQDGCRGAVEVVKSPGGLRALVSCDEDAPRAIRRSPPVSASVAAPRVAVVVEPKVSSKTAAKVTVNPEALVRAPEREAVALKAALVLQPPVARESAAKTSQVSGAVTSQTATLTPTPTLTPTGIAPAGTPTAVATPSGGLPALQTVQGSSSGGGRSSGIVLAGLLLCGLAGGAFVFARRRAKGSRYVTILETASLGPKRAIIVARIGDATMILGSSEAGITVLQASAEATERGAGRSILASLSSSRGSFAGDREPMLTHPGAAAGAIDKRDDHHGHDSDDDADGDSTAGAGPAQDDQLADLDEPAAQGGLLARFFKPAANANGSSSAQSFESLLEDSLEDQELRRKLSLGLAGRTR